ncbi:hypothetical protein ACIBQX_17530 [Nonomuraea sp. NPDC049714]|uniref:hypothetical protein n=1 Tax=Nonomuraea sp. NPDC049714 TaxID=3364357 RepID=UPI0037A6F91A
MGFWRTVLGLARKKFVGPPVVVAAVVLALAGFFLVPSRYVSTASMVLTVPASGGTLETEPRQRVGLTNPLLQFNDALRTTAGILILATNTPEVAAEIGVTEDGPTALTINDGRTNPDLLGISTNGPFVYIEVESTSPQLVRETMRKAQLRVKLELARRQVALDAPISTHIGVLDVMPASIPKPLIQDRLVAGVAGGLLGVVAGLTAAYAVLRLRASRTAPAEAAGIPSARTGTPAAEGETAAGNGDGLEEAGAGNDARPPEPPVFPLTVAELEAGQDGESGENGSARAAVDDTGPIEVVVPRDDQPDSTT